MKKYDYKEATMFFLWDNETTNDFGNNVCKYFKKKYNISVKYENKQKEYINLKFITNDNFVLLNFKYDESLFYNCYRHDGKYECNKYIGTRAVIHKLISYIFDEYLLITKKEPLICHKCGKPTGVVFNDFDADDKSICAGGGINDDTKRLYDYYEEGINKCYKCGKYFCDECSRDNYNCEYNYDNDFVCEYCEEDEFENYNCDGHCDECIYDGKCNYEENLLNSKWHSCKFEDDDERYEECDECKYREECISDAEDNKCGYESFCDIVSDAYGSVDAFWECNGI